MNYIRSGVWAELCLCVFMYIMHMLCNGFGMAYSFCWLNVKFTGFQCPRENEESLYGLCGDGALLCAYI